MDLILYAVFWCLLGFFSEARCQGVLVFPELSGCSVHSAVMQVMIEDELADETSLRLPPRQIVRQAKEKR